MKNFIAFIRLKHTKTWRKISFLVFVFVFSTISKSHSQTWTTIDSKKDQWINCVFYDSVTSTHYFGGRFDTLFSVAANAIIAFDGVTWFAVGDGFNGVVTSIIRYNGELIAAGAFDSSGNVPLRAPIAKWDGSNWLPMDIISHFDDKGFSPNLFPDIQDMCIHNGSLYFCGSFVAWPNSQNPIGYSDFAKYDGNILKSVLFPYYEVNCQSCNLESFKGNLYLAKDPGSKDTCIGIPVSFPDGLFALDTSSCWRFAPVGQWPITTLYKMFSTDSLLYIGLEYPSTTFGNFFTAYDGNNFMNIGNGFNGTVGFVGDYNGKLLVAGAFNASFNNQISLPNFAEWDGVNWQPLNSNCNLNYGLGQICIYDNFVIASGFFDSCGINPIGNIVSYPSSILTGIDEEILSISQPKFIYNNYNLSIVFNESINESNYQVAIYNSLGQKVISSKCCELNLSAKSIRSGIYFIEVVDRKFKRRFTHKMFISAH